MACSLWVGRLATVLVLLGLLSGAGHTQTVLTRLPYKPFANTPCPVIQVTLPDGTVGHFLFDTGSDINLITDRLVARLGLKPSPAPSSDKSLPSSLIELKKLRLHPFSDPSTSLPHPLPDPQNTLVMAPVRLGDLAFHAPMYVVDATALATLGEPLDGVIGNLNLQKLAVLFDFHAQQITLLSGGPLTPALLQQLQMAGATVVAQVPSPSPDFRVRVRLNQVADLTMGIDTGALTPISPNRWPGSFNCRCCRTTPSR